MRSRSCGPSGRPQANDHLVWGIFEYDTPSDIYSGGDYLKARGTWSFVQTWGGAWSINDDPTVVSGLDGGFPCAKNGRWAVANGLDVLEYSDAPGQKTSSPNDLGTPGYQIDYADDIGFNLYVFYLPPQSLDGQSTYVPARLTPWFARGTCHGTSPAVWTLGDDNNTNYGDEQDYPPFPTW